MKKQEIVVKSILQQGMLPLFYNDSLELSLEIIHALYRAGVRVVEYTNRGASALENFRQLSKECRKNLPGLFLGAGTIKTIEEANLFIDAGVDFVVCPVIIPQVGDIVHHHGLLWIPGAMTPTEILLAQKCEAKFIKIFPANILGPEFISSIRELFPDVRFIPTGGVELNAENIQKWFRAGVSAVGMGSRLISKEIMESGSFDKLYENTVEALSLVKEARQ